MHVAFQIPCVYDYITKLYRKQAEIILNNENGNVLNIGQGLNLAAVTYTTIQVSRLPWYCELLSAGHNLLC
jgi:hypothetical protein